MENIDLTIAAILAISAFFNVFFLWFVVKVARKLLFVSTNLDDLNNAINNFDSHLQSVYEQETFYGDDILQRLMAHSQALSEYFETFEDIYELANTIEDEEDLNNDYDGRSDGEQESFETPETTQKNKKTVFYAGP